MTVLVASVLATLTVAFATFLSDVGRVAVTRARAQTAADAAALAAAAESAAPGSGAPVAAARAFAARNGARVTACDCAPLEHGAQVTVEIDGVPATARAEVDTKRVRRGGNGLDPRLAQAVERLLDASGGRVWVTSGARTPAEQRRLWAAAMARYGDAEVADDWVARPGTSAHERGLAVDLGGDLSLAVRLVERLGLPLRRPMSWEPWHFELAP